jgi:hypothetical protein
VTGSQGPAGPPGGQGAAGGQGPKGPTGPTGPGGATGAQGVDGGVGVQGSQGATGAPGPTGPSDSRLKKNIREIESPLDKVQKMRGVSFIWNEEVLQRPNKDIGFIAQEIAHVFPELVFKANDSENAKYMVKYHDVVAVCLEAIKEQSGMLNNSLTKLERLEELVIEKGY